MSDEGITVGNDGGASGAPVVPSISEMISSSIGTGTREPRATALDALDIQITGLEDSAPAARASSASAPIVEAKRRGRPPRGSSPAPQLARGSSRKKADLAAELERVQAELANERARHDSDKIAELAKLVEMACHMGFGFAASKRGDHWMLSAQEGKDIGSSGAVVLAPYAEQAAAHMPWMTFAAVLGHAVWSRVQIDEKNVAALNAARPVQ